jgi:hypothetical protein
VFFVNRKLLRGSYSSFEKMKRPFERLQQIFVWFLAVALVWPAPAHGYAVLAHEAIIDAVWETNLKPLLLKRFPQATEEELSGAQAYAYGGSIVQDMGYYPYGNPFFSELTHYVRSGDFILALLRDSKDLDEYAFALGSLAHYAADNNGHRMATNRAVPILYPKLKKKYGDSVSYEEDPLAHAKTEFGFDVLEVAQESYAPDGYHDFIGFEVSQPVLNQAFQETYGLEMKDILYNETKALNSYRRGVSRTIPKATKIAWTLKKDEIKDDLPGMTQRKFRYNLSRSNYEKEWGQDYQKPTFGEKFLAFVYRIIPKFGPLKVLQFKTPTPETQRMFRASFNATLDRYRELLTEWGDGKLELPNDNFDLGEESGPGKYKLNDDAQAELLDRLAAQKFAGTPPEMREELLRFFSDPDAAYATKSNPKAWAKVQAQLEQLKAAVPAPSVAGSSATAPQAPPPMP